MEIFSSNELRTESSVILSLLTFLVDSRERHGEVGGRVALPPILNRFYSNLSTLPRFRVFVTCWFGFSFLRWSAPSPDPPVSQLSQPLV